jgi:signal transduction histidine kinase
MNRLKEFLRPKIATKLTGWFLLITLVPLAIVVYLANDRGKEQLQHEIMNKLVVMTAERVNKIENYIRETQRTLELFVMQPSAVQALETLENVARQNGLRSPEYAAAEGQLRPGFFRYQAITGFQDLTFISPEGDVIFSLNRKQEVGRNYKTGLLRDSAAAKAFDVASTLLATEVSDFEFLRGMNEPEVYMATPFLKSGKMIGIAMVRLNTQEIYALASDYRGLGETGETVIGSKIGNQVVFVAPTRHDPYAFFKRKIDIESNPAAPLVQAVEGKKGQGISIDYRDKEVLAVWRYVPFLGWGMVVKVDAAEVFAPINRLRQNLLSILMVTMGLTVFVSFLISRSISNPIQELQRGTEIIGEGNWSYKVALDSRDEIGDLSRAFDKMTEHLEKTTASRDQLNAMALQLQRSNRELEDFAYVVSHDLKAPLRGISSISTWLKEDYADKFDAEGKHQLDLLKNRALRMDTLISGILQYSRVGSVDEAEETVDLNLLVGEIIENLNAPPHILIAIAEPLPVLKCPQVKMHQVFQNLISNAIKFSDKEKGAIMVRCQDQGDAWQFCVEDNGAGIDPKNFEKVFKLFQTLDNQNRSENTGVGLALVKRIIELRGGRVWVESKVGEGSRFFFRWPLAPAPKGELR